MEKQAATPGKAFLALIALVAWFALIAQFYLHINSGAAPLPELITRYFTYFTILTNILVAVCCSSLLLKPASRWGRFFSRTGNLAAITVYIVIVGITYNTILRSIWNPQGLQRVVDELLHVGTPVLFLLYWLVFAPKAGLQWKNAFPWLWFPFLYGVVILIRGALSGWYPYPFFDVPKIGAARVAINTVALLAAFLVVSWALIALARAMSRKV